MSQLIHRECGREYSLCRQHVPKKRLTIYDDKVTCPDCLDELDSLHLSDTKTSTIKKIRASNEKHKDM